MSGYLQRLYHTTDSASPVSSLSHLVSHPCKYVQGDPVWFHHFTTLHTLQNTPSQQSSIHTPLLLLFKNEIRSSHRSVTGLFMHMIMNPRTHWPKTQNKDSQPERISSARIKLDRESRILRIIGGGWGLRGPKTKQKWQQYLEAEHLRETDKTLVTAWLEATIDGPRGSKTPSITLWHASSNHCHNWFLHRSLKTVS